MKIIRNFLGEIEDVEEGEELFDEPDTLERREDERAARADFDNRPGPDGWARSDFIYDPLSRKGFE